MRSTTTTRGLPRIHPQMNSYTVDHYRLLAGLPDRLDLNPSYQRGSVWGVERKRNLIMEPDRVVDGKQRIEAILDFLGDRLAVPAAWFSVADLVHNDGGWVTGEWVMFSDLTLPAQRRFRSATVATYQTKLRIEAEERELFLLINYGGVAQGDMDADVRDGR
jgi:hypothetical protein